MNRFLRPALVVVALSVATSARADLLYISQQIQNTILTYDTSASPPTPTTFATGLNQPSNIAFDLAGNLYVANSNGNTIEKFTSGGVGSVFASGFHLPTGLVFDSAGNLYVANYLTSTIEKFTPGGVGSIFATSSSGVFFPPSLAIDSAGNIYSRGPTDGGDSIWKFTPGGVGSFFASAGSGGSGGPYGLAFDASGNLYAALSSDAILKFNPDGIGSQFTTGLDSESGLAFAPSAVPEPSSLLLLGTSVLIVVGFVCRCRK